MNSTDLVAATLCPSAWQLDVVDEVPSTNVIAGRFPPWQAVRAVSQTAGRGRSGRRWISDVGGLWLSAVVPCPGPRSRWAILPLAAGQAVIGALEEFGVTGLRLRWPNDVMCGPRKLAGLLVERFSDDSAVIGLGLNIFNSPESVDPLLHRTTARLADLAPGTYTVDEVAGTILEALAQMHQRLLREGFGPVADALNRGWSESRRVAVTLTGSSVTCTGHFEGIDDRGRLQLAIGGDGVRLYDATEVALLRELE